MDHKPNIGDRVVLTNNSYAYYGAYKEDIGIVVPSDYDSIGVIFDESIKKTDTNILYVSEEDLELV